MVFIPILEVDLCTPTLIIKDLGQYLEFGLLLQVMLLKLVVKFEP